MAFEKTGEANIRLANYFPGAVTPTWGNIKVLLKDSHSIMFGERIRFKNLLGKIEQVQKACAMSGFSPSLCHSNILKAIHDMYVGTASMVESGRHSVPMYDGTHTDFPKDMEIWFSACGDVERFYEFTRSFLAPSPGPRKIAEREKIIRNEGDPVKLINLMRGIGEQKDKKRKNKPHVRKQRHAARLKLTFGQFYFEQRRDSKYSPEKLQLIGKALIEFFDENLFDSDKDEILVIATLNEKMNLRCKDWTVYRKPEQLPCLKPNQRVLGATRRWIRINGERIPLLCFVRTKDHSLMKALSKHTRFLQLGGLGDGIGVRFVVERHHLEKIVDRVRDVLVACPGQVCDQASSIGERQGRKLDRLNTRSSTLFEAMKYNAMAWSQIIEVQFTPWESWVDSECSKTEVNHKIYKLKGLFQDVLPILYPESLYGINWEIGSPVWDQCAAYVLGPNFRIR